MKAVDLLEASESCDVSRVKSAIVLKEDLNVKSDSGSTPILVAAGNGCGDVVKALIAAGANVNAKASDGGTALIAASSDHPDLVSILIAAGANINAQDDHGVSALETAAMNGQPLAAQALLAAGADPNARDQVGTTPLYWATTTSRFGTPKGHAEVAALLRQHGGHS
jgi:serine/threonine-protein phosphatase 6 regulatory ankyrin repeat subunit B